MANTSEDKRTHECFDSSDFLRDNDAPDSGFYTKPRFVDHLDSLATSTVEDLFVRLIPRGAKILDLMASHKSHIRVEMDPKGVTGLGLNHDELEANPILTERVIRDINNEPVLPFPDECFDAVVNTVSIDYVEWPLELFGEVARILQPDGIFIVVFSNRMFPPKAVNIWKRSTEPERVDLVKRYFSLTGDFFLEGTFESKGKPRPRDDKYYSYGIPSDPIYAVWGRKRRSGN